MKFTVHRDVLKEAVGWVSKAIPNRPATPVLSGILVTSNGDGVVLSAFDYEQYAEAEVATAVASGEGRVLVSGRMFADIVKGLPAKDVTFDTDGTKVKVAAGSSKFTMTCMAVDDYPPTPAVPVDGVRVDVDVFAGAVGQVTVAASRDDTLPILRTVKVDVAPEDGVIRFSATDRYRLAAKTIDVEPVAGLAGSTHLVSARFLDSVTKSSPMHGELTFVTWPNGVAVRSHGFVASTTVTDGEYPAVHKLFPDTVNETVTVDANELYAAVKRVALVAEKNTAVRLSFADGAVTLKAGSDDVSSASESIDADFTDAPGDVAFNPNFLIDGLNSIGGRWAQFEFVAPSKPTVIRALLSQTGDVDDTYRHLLMPVRVG